MELGAEAAIRRFGDLRISVDSHRRLVEAIEAGDPERAERAMYDHLGYLRDALGAVRGS
jgi:DNA-binding GntR family transcriptional regulator